MTLTVDDLADAARGAAAFRRRRRLQPAGGPGDKIFPPTYPGDNGPHHVFEVRRIDGSEVVAVLIDSVQSQANRFEEALAEAAAEGRIRLPRLYVDFASTGLNAVPDISVLDAPHRIFDAILRDSLLDGTPFRESGLGERLRLARPHDATAILEAAPTALLFGSWNSTGEGGGLGAKFARAITSEIVGIGVPVEEVTNPRTGEVTLRSAGRRTGSRIDPLGIVRSVDVFKSSTGWDVDQAAAGKGRQLRRALMHAWDDPVPGGVSGHATDGRPLDTPHLAIIPLANVGWRWADGRVMGLAIVPPRCVVECWDDRTPETWADRRAFERALDRLVEGGRLDLRLGKLGVWRLAREVQPSAASLDPLRYLARARRFSTVTPIALDRHPKGDKVQRNAEAAEIIVTACTRIGLPAPAKVVVHKHSAILGAPSARPPGGVRVPSGWARPGHLSSRPLVHATLSFDGPVHGPLILGAGRFSGLGLCLPLEEARR